MFRHISLFTLEAEPTNGKTKEENIQTLKEMLEKLPEIEPSIVNNAVGTALPGPPGMPAGGPGFYEVAQVIDFETQEACMAYPMTAAHGTLIEFGQGVIKDVGIIDYEF